MTTSCDIKELSIKKLLENTDGYFIPMYQRNYAWDEAEITQLIQDVIDYAPEGREYYIGTLVVYERKDKRFEVIDGQQRLTTLSLLIAYLKKENKDTNTWNWCEPDKLKLKLRYESRDYSSKTFDAIFDGKNLSGMERDAIVHGYQLIEKILPGRLKETPSQKVNLTSFTEFLLNKVRIMRVPVPEDTELNHYFEIMNSRGEQLEKHEVLKARLMDTLQKGITDEAEKRSSLHCLNKVWEACANMEKYVQQGFSAVSRAKLFGDDWETFTVTNFDDVLAALCRAEANEKSDNKQSFTDIIAPTKANDSSENPPDDKARDLQDRFHAVINFPNFLLQVLCISTGVQITLDDKKLISEFETHIKTPEEVKTFIFNLLKTKYLFDRYIIKRDFSQIQDGKWSLKRYKKSSTDSAYFVDTFGKDDQEEDGTIGDNRRILMLLSAFHVSTPTMVYKYWLSAALRFLFRQTEVIKAQSYLTHLELIAKRFVFDHFLAEEGKRMGYFKLIFDDSEQFTSQKAAFTDDYLKDKLSYGNIDSNLIFNYLDYLLWDADQYPQGKQNLKSKFDKFEFTFRSSVEHLYPQTPFAEDKHITDDVVDSFGNLCLISHRRNSALGNRWPQEKRNYYKNNGIIDSIKQELMFSLMDQNNGNWGEKSIKDHFETMKSTLLNSLG